MHAHILTDAAVNSLEGLSEDLRLYLPLFAEAVLRLGTVEHSMEFLEDEIKLKTGGISADTHISTNPSSLEVSEEGLVFSGHCLDKNVPHLLELLKTVLLETNFAAISKLRTLIHGIASGFANSLAENGHGFARTFAAAPFTPAAVSFLLVCMLACSLCPADLSREQAKFLVA